MSFKFQCLCGQHYLGTEQLVGRKLLCKACKTKVVVPGPGSNGGLPVAEKCESAYAGRLPGTRPLPPHVELPGQAGEGGPPGRAAVEPPRRFPTQEAKSLVVPVKRQTLRDLVRSQELYQPETQAEFETPPEGLEQAISQLAEYANDIKRMHEEEVAGGNGSGGEMKTTSEGITRPYGKGDLALLLGSGFRRACSSIAAKRS